MTHKKEICRWARTADRTRVWYKGGGGWDVTFTPLWRPDTYYIVDDKHAQLRMRWIDAGMPPLEIFHKATEKWLPVEGTPNWDLDAEYRIKPKEWYDKLPLLCWVWDDDAKHKKPMVVTGYYPATGIFKAVYSNYKHAEPLTPEEAERFVLQ